MKDVTRTLVRYIVAARFEDIPPQVRREATRALLNAHGCAIIWWRCTNTSVLTPRCAINHAASTVLPNAVVAESTPKSCASIAAPAFR